MDRGRSLVGGVLVLLTACGGGGPETVDLVRPSDACDEAFAAAAGSSGDDASPEEAGTEDSATLLALAPTLDACQGHDDWLAGARAHPQTLPDRMDRGTALRLLCEDDRDAAPCRPLESPSSGGRG